MTEGTELITLQHQVETLRHRLNMLQDPYYKLLHEATSSYRASLHQCVCSEIPEKQTIFSAVINAVMTVLSHNKTKQRQPTDIERKTTMSKSAIEQLKKEISELSERLDESEESLIDRTNEKFHALKDTSVEKAKLLADKTCDIVKEKPLISLIGAASIGALAAVAAREICSKKSAQA